MGFEVVGSKIAGGKVAALGIVVRHVMADFEQGFGAEGRIVLAAFVGFRGVFHEFGKLAPNSLLFYPTTSPHLTSPGIILLSSQLEVILLGWKRFRKVVWQQAQLIAGVNSMEQARAPEM